MSEEEDRYDPCRECGRDPCECFDCAHCGEAHRDCVCYDECPGCGAEVRSCFCERKKGGE